jgi:general secretion pathway protein A
VSIYGKYYGLRASPFGVSPDPRFLYRIPRVSEALAALHYGITARKGFVVLTGEVGTGKTTLLNAVLGSFTADRVLTAFLFNPCLEVLDFLEFVLTDFGIPLQSRTKSGMLLQLNRWLVERFRAHQTCVIVVDEAQNLSTELLEEIRLLTNLETSSEKLLQIVLCGQPELEEKLREPGMRQLRQRVSLWCRTQSLTCEETAAYVAERLRIAGATVPILSPVALQQIHHYSGGIPRVINLICEHSLITGYVEQVKLVSARIVEAVAQELELEQQTATLSPLPSPAPVPYARTTIAGATPVACIPEDSSKGRSV